MYSIIKSVIESQRFELNDMLRKIDVTWLQGQIIDEEKAELIELARAKADPTMSIDIYKHLENLDASVDDLDKRVTALEPEKPTEEFPPYVPGKVYRTGDKITYKGEHYVCKVPEGGVCVWSPDDYPAYWQKVDIK